MVWSRSATLVVLHWNIHVCCIRKDESEIKTKKWKSVSIKVLSCLVVMLGNCFHFCFMNIYYDDMF